MAENLLTEMQQPSSKRYSSSKFPSTTLSTCTTVTFNNQFIILQMVSVSDINVNFINATHCIIKTTVL